MPGLNGFVGEFLILVGAYRANWLWATVAGTAVILSAVYMLWMFQRVNYGVVTNPKNERLPDLLPREWAALGPAVALAVLMGVLPGLFLRPSEPAVTRVVQRLQAHQTRTVHAAAPPARLADAAAGTTGAHGPR